MNKPYDFNALIRFLDDCEVEDKDLEAMQKWSKGPLLAAIEKELERRETLRSTPAPQRP